MVGLGRLRLVAATLSAVLTVGGCVPPFHSSAPVQYAPGADGLGDVLYPKAGNGGYDVKSYDLSVRFEPTTGVLTGTAVITAVADENLNRFDLDLHGLQVGSVKVGDAVATFDRSGDELVITPTVRLDKGMGFVVTVTYSGVPKPYDEPDLGTDGF